MKRLWLITRYISMLAICHIPIICPAQVKIIGSVFSNGSSVISDTTTTVAGTMGQSLIETVSNDSIIIKSGFWALGKSFYTSIDPIRGLFPATYQLYQNFPNPFNPITTIRFTIPRISRVKICLLDALGRRVAILLDRTMARGNYQINFDGTGLSSGVYFCRLQAEQFSQMKKLILLK